MVKYHNQIYPKDIHLHIKEIAAHLDANGVCNVTEAEYNSQLQEYSRQIKVLTEQQSELKTTVNRHAEILMWLDFFEDHIQSGEIFNSSDAIIIWKCQ